MGNTLNYYSGIEYFKDDHSNHLQEDGRFSYAIFDPTQTAKPQDRTKDIISSANKDKPSRLDTVDYKGCDTVWKCFKRSVWRHPNRPFMGERG